MFCGVRGSHSQLVPDHLQLNFPSPPSKLAPSCIPSVPMPLPFKENDTPSFEVPEGCISYDSSLVEFADAINGSASSFLSRFAQADSRITNMKNVGICNFIKLLFKIISRYKTTNSINIHTNYFSLQKFMSSD